MSDEGEPDEREQIRERKRRELEERLSGEGGATAVEASVAPAEPVHVEGADHLDELASRYGVVLVDYYADWCGPCQMLEPIVATVARDTEAAVAKVDIDRHQGLAAQAGVRGVPTLVVYANGEPVQRLVGMQDEGTLRDLVQQYA